MQLLFSIRTNQPEVQTNRKHKPTGSTNQPEAQTNRKNKYALLIKPNLANKKAVEQ